MTHPLDDPAAASLVLVNAQGSYSLWPAFLNVPAGWSIALPASDRETCRAYLQAHWRDCGRSGSSRSHA